MNNPFRRRRLRLTADDRAAWGEYERKNRAAADQYEAIPISFHRLGVGDRCTCGKKAIASGPCKCETYDLKDIS
jgi:hypothetical protein